MIILGIDPGLATIGFGVIENNKGRLSCIDYGAIKTKPGYTLGERLSIIRKDFLQLVKEYRPDLVGMEELFFVKNVTNGLKVAHARGVILQHIDEQKIPLLEFTPLQIKNNITGDGGAQKWQVQEMTKRLLHLKSIPKPDDAADALAVALCADQAYANHLV